MNIKPCPACESDDIGRASLEYSEKHKRACVCGVQGPWADSPAEADAAWNAMPRRGDGPAWRSEPPDRPGWWWTRYRLSNGSWSARELCRLDLATVRLHRNRTTCSPYQWSGPIPEPPAPDAEKEVAK